jgi:transcriptional regulator with XRE-family HTH domain
MNKTQRRAREKRAKLIADKLGATLRAQRQARGLSLDALAAMTHIDKSWLSKMERGEAGTLLVGYEDIARALGWTLPAMFAAAFPPGADSLDAR